MKSLFQMCIVTVPKIDILNFKLNILIKQVEIYSPIDHNNNGASIGGLTQTLENLK
jgi:hypothetical protein